MTLFSLYLYLRRVSLPLRDLDTISVSLLLQWFRRSILELGHFSMYQKLDVLPFPKNLNMFVIP